jgi:glutamate N-acetyltransferase / amino-acid N-acetyltransferase
MTPVPAEAGKNTKSVTVARETFVIPGFRVAAVASGMRYTGRPDLALIVADEGDGAVAAGVFTMNEFCAAPVIVCEEHLRSSSATTAILVNAGIANACTGDTGLRQARETARLTARALEVAQDQVLVASTGVIGVQLQVEPIARLLPELLEGLRADGWDQVARAIMTTDTVPKLATTQVQVGGKLITVGGVAKGAGMIAPNMATLLAFVCTDAAVEKDVLQHWVRVGADASFNAITIDGDTSTNDSLLVLAGGAAGNPVISDKESPDSRLFGEALRAVLLDLSKQIVSDGEGATKLIEIRVTGALDDGSARQVAFTIANSPLVKTAFFGEDANWGRIIAAAGRAGVHLISERVALYFEDLCVFREGTPVGTREVEEKATHIFRQKEIAVRLDLGLGSSSFTAYTCDFSYDYVKVNASYRS